MQTKRRHYFLCERWLAVEKDDGEIERLLPVSTSVQKTQLVRLLKKESKEKFKDSHLWLSIFMRPKQSGFSRLERCICAFTLLYMCMLMNIMYYDLASEETGGNALVIGPVKITLQQIGIGITVNLIVMPPSLLLIALFAKSRRRVTQLKSLKKKLQSNNWYVTRSNIYSSGGSKYMEDTTRDGKSLLN